MKTLSRWLVLMLSLTLIFTSAAAAYADAGDTEPAAVPGSSKTEETGESPESEDPEGTEDPEADKEDVQNEDPAEDPQEGQGEEAQMPEEEDDQDAGALSADPGSDDGVAEGSDDTQQKTEKASGGVPAETAPVDKNADPETYTVTWLDYNGDTSAPLEVDENVEAGSAPQYNGSTPARTASAKYTFTFAGWATAKGAAASEAVQAGDLQAVSGDVTYYAVYKGTLRSYKVKFANGYGGTICTRTVYYGKAATAPAAPKRSGYDFAGWNKAFTKITGNLTVTAKWTKHVHKYRWTVNTKATYFAEGKKTGVCSCGRKVTKTIPKLTGKNIWVRDSRGNRYYLNSKGQFLTRWNKVVLQGTNTVYWAYFNSKGKYKVSYSANTRNMFMMADSFKFYFDDSSRPVGGGFHYIDDDLYYMNKYGAVKYGTFKASDGYTYRTDSQGHIGGIALYRYRYGTFVLVDLSSQTFCYYSDGYRRLAGDVVTGTRNLHDTPTGVFSIRSKLRGIYLTGPTWRSYVNYWMAFIGSSYGLHDASWRTSSQFSDPDTYINNGSHGCVNMRYSDAASLYELVRIGTTVIVQD